MNRLDDEELFGALVPSALPVRPEAPDQQEVAARGEVIVRMIAGKGIPTPYGFDPEAGYLSYGAALYEYKPTVIAQAIETWTSEPEPTWPTVPELTTLVKYIYDSQRPAPEPMKPGACPTCGDSYAPGHIDHTPNKGGPHDLEPCPDCNGEKRELVQSGHLAPFHQCHRSCIGWDERAHQPARSRRR